MKMMRRLFTVLLILFFIACTKNGSKANDNKIVLENTDTISFHGKWIAKDTLSIYHYLDTIAYYINDSSLAIQMANTDASQNVYFFMEFGLMASPLLDETEYNTLLSQQKKICSHHNIWIFNMGCEDSEIGRIYTREMKKLLKEKKGLNYDSIFTPNLCSL